MFKINLVRWVHRAKGPLTEGNRKLLLLEKDTILDTQTALRGNNLEYLNTKAFSVTWSHLRENWFTRVYGEALGKGAGE